MKTENDSDSACGYIVLICRNDARGIGEPADFGRDGEPEASLLMIRKRAAFFRDKTAAEAAIVRTLEYGAAMKMPWIKTFGFQIVRCYYEVQK